MAKVFLSFLGTTNYKPCSYIHGAGEVPDVRFVQEATIKTFCAAWKPADRFLIFTTPKAKQKNWLDNGHTNEANEPIQVEGLETRLKKLLPGAQIAAVDIPEGKTQEEIWDIFQKIIDQLQDGDEVVFDITHGFRSIPLLAIVVLSYARVMKSITIRGIYYGAFEAASNGSAPIFDLTEFDVLLEWTTALDRFLKAGDASLACELAETEVKKRKQQIKGADPVLAAFNKVTKKLSEFSLSLATCRGPYISDVARQLKQALKDCVGLKGMRPYVPLLEKVSQELDQFPGDFVRDGLSAAQWCAHHNLVQQGFTILQETLISHFTVNVLKDDLRDLTSRTLVNQALKIFSKNLPQEKWEEPAKSHPKKVEPIVKAFKKYPGMEKVLGNLGNDRNDINHAGHKKNTMAADKFGPKLREYIVTFQKFLER